MRMNIRTKEYLACFHWTLSNHLLGICLVPDTLLAPSYVFSYNSYNSSGMHYYLDFKHKERGGAWVSQACLF